MGKQYGRRRWALGSGLLLIIGILPASAQDAIRSSPSTDAVRRGEYVAGAANCANCHTTQGGLPFAGGPALSTPFGIFYPPNITPDPAHGIGLWSFDNFKRALRRGVSPENTHYYPVFPYPSFTGMSDADLADLWAYLRTVPPVAEASRPHEVGFPFNVRLLLAPWQILFLVRGPIEPDPGKSLEWNRGHYLVEAVTHCAECHTPRNLLGAVERNRYMAGQRDAVEGWDVPNISPDSETGIGRWSVEELAGCLGGGGMRAMHVRGPMREVVQNTSNLTDADRLAMAVYLKSLPPRYGEVKPDGMGMGMMGGGGGRRGGGMH
jgi:mono/diheme cytochrome c family protein